jgi:hypothetical protein
MSAPDDSGGKKPRSPRPVINLDQDPRNRDWTRSSSWDMYLMMGKELKIVETLEELAFVMNWEPSKLEAEIRRFLNLPIAEAMPPKLQEELQQFLHS